MNWSPCRRVTRAQRTRASRLIRAAEREVNWHPKLSRWTGTKVALRRHLES